jgi:hypothetical protein
VLVFRDCLTKTLVKRLVMILWGNSLSKHRPTVSELIVIFWLYEYSANSLVLSINQYCLRIRPLERVNFLSPFTLGRVMLGRGGMCTAPLARGAIAPILFSIRFMGSIQAGRPSRRWSRDIRSRRMADLDIETGRWAALPLSTISIPVAAPVDKSLPQ